jgi:hypothetical protein
MMAVDENRQPIKYMWKGMPDWKNVGGSDEGCDLLPPEERSPSKCFLSAGAAGFPATASRIGLYHYATKSLEDFASKMLRGSGMSKATKQMEYFADISRCAFTSHLLGFLCFSSMSGMQRLDA